MNRSILITFLKVGFVYERGLRRQKLLFGIHLPRTNWIYVILFRFIWFCSSVLSVLLILFNYCYGLSIALCIHLSTKYDYSGNAKRRTYCECVNTVHTKLRNKNNSLNNLMCFNIIWRCIVDFLFAFLKLIS